METQVIDVHNGMVRISCPDDYHFSTLKRHRDFLMKAFHQFIGKRVAIEPVLSSKADIPVKTVFTTISSVTTGQKKLEPASSQNTLVLKEHPILTLLKHELGAERVE